MNKLLQNLPIRKLKLWQITSPYKGSQGRWSTKGRADLDAPLSRREEQLLAVYVTLLIDQFWDKTAGPPGDGFIICLKRAARDGTLPGFGEFVAEQMARMERIQHESARAHL
ncbi:MAG: hypothetical protein ACLP5H_20190 [Desulfomonilaceae bacterium]